MVGIDTAEISWRTRSIRTAYLKLRDWDLFMLFLIPCHKGLWEFGKRPNYKSGGGHVTLFFWTRLQPICNVAQMHGCLTSYLLFNGLSTFNILDCLLTHSEPKFIFSWWFWSKCHLFLFFVFFKITITMIAEGFWGGCMLHPSGHHGHFWYSSQPFTYITIDHPLAYVCVCQEGWLR